MSMDATRLNGARYTSVLADLLTQFPVAAGLLPAETAYATTFRQKMAHSVADHEGTDVVTEITGNAKVPVGIGVNSSTFLTNTQGTVI